MNSAIEIGCLMVENHHRWLLGAGNLLLNLAYGSNAMMAVCAGFRRAVAGPRLPFPPLARCPGRPHTPAYHLHRLLLETDTHATVHLARESRFRQPGPALVSVR